MVSLLEATWAAGLFEGEGCISTSGAAADRKTGAMRQYPRLMLGMTDEDSVRRFHEAVDGLGTITERPAKGKRQRVWLWRLNGYAGCSSVVGLLWHGLGARRRARAVEVLKACRPVDSVKSNPNRLTW